MQFEFRCNLKLCCVSSPTNLADPGCIWMVCVFSLKPNVNALICKKTGLVSCRSATQFFQSRNEHTRDSQWWSINIWNLSTTLNHDLSWFYHDPLPGLHTQVLPLSTQTSADEVLGSRAASGNWLCPHPLGYFSWFKMVSIAWRTIWICFISRLYPIISYYQGLVNAELTMTQLLGR